MYKQKLVLLLFVFLFCSASRLFSQIVVSPSVGCAPAGVTNALFTYTGPGTPVNITWNYGDSSPTSTLTTTQHSYPNVGSYTVTFSATIGGSPVTYTALVVVHPPPTGSMAAPVIPSNHCIPMSVGFSASSTQSNLLYTWAFGDLSGGGGTSVTHVYTSPGSFTPNVTISNSLTGCFVNISGAVIHVSSPPFISINVTPASFTCAPTFTTNFNVGNSSSGSPIPGGGLTYNWNFGSFGSSTQASAGPIVFTPVGVYTVVLTATDNNNCSSSATQLISLLSPTVSAIVPASVCVTRQMTVNPAVFNVTVNSNQPFTMWDMGDGTVQQFPIPVPPPQVTPTLTPNMPYTAPIHGYVNSGLKTLTITATAGQCVATVTKTIFVEVITPGFTGVAPANGCSQVYTVSLLNQTTVNSASSLSYTWHTNHWSPEGPMIISNATNPTFTVTQGSTSPYANYLHPPYYITDTMFVVSALGCRADTALTLDTLQRPTADFEINFAEGCVPLAATFINTSATNATLFPIVSYTWSFGASASSTLAGVAVTTGTVPIPPAQFTYVNPGTYYATLSITTASGCVSTSYIHTITVSSPPPFTYAFPTTTTCVKTPVTITLTPGPGQNIQHWHINADDQYWSGCTSYSTPTWEFNHPGVQDFTISAYQDGCKSTSVVTSAMTVKGPIARLRYETNCSVNRKSVKFYYNLDDATSAIIDFGDSPTSTVSITGAADSLILGDITHVYQAAGDYTATITSYNTLNGCPGLQYWVAVKVRELAADFVFTNSVICVNAPLFLDALLSVDVFTTCGRGYSWYIDNYPPQQVASPSFIATNSFTTVGMYPVTLVVKDVNGCKASVTKSFRVSSPAPDFTFNSNPICKSNMPLQLINLTPQFPDSVKKYEWNMGDSTLFAPSTPPSTTIGGLTYSHSPTFSYMTFGGNQSYTFAVILTATNSIGCADSTRHVITVNDPFINVTPAKYAGCAPQAMTFSFQAAGTHTSYNVNYGVGTSSNITTFTTNNIYTSTYVYTTPGTYTPVMTVTDFGGCVKTQTLPPIIIQSYPVASFTFCNRIDGAPGTSTFCAPLSPSVTSTTNSLYLLFYTWDLGIGGPMTIGDYSATTNYPEQPATYTISLKVSTSPGECSSTTQSVVTVYSPKIDFKLSPDPLRTTYCLGEPITLTITSFPGVLQYQWDFGDGVVRPPVYPVASIPSTLLKVYENNYFPEATNGEVTIELVGYAPGGFCKEVKRKKVNLIRALPDFKRNNELLALDSVHCFGQTEVFTNLSTTNASSQLLYKWSLGNGVTDSSINVSHVYAAPGTYTVKLSVLEPSHGCRDSVSKKMIIFPLPKAVMDIDSFSCPGSPFKITGSGTPGVSGILTGTIFPGPQPVSFDPSNSFSLSTTASVSTTYSLNVTDNNGCENSAKTASIFIQQPAPVINWDTTIVIGQPTPLNAYVGPGFSYTWTPEVSYLNCDTCLIHNPISTTTMDITYSVAVEDGHQCSVVKNTYRIHVETKVSLDVPSAFTPNGDGINDIIYPDGWGLRKLNYFKVFNRWGQLVFESNDLNVGWDGVFQGVPQNMETYVYQVSAETYEPTKPVLTKSGTFKLLR